MASTINSGVHAPTANHPDNVADCHELIDELMRQIQQMNQRVEFLTQKLFGRSSERMHIDPAELTFFGIENFPGLEINMELPEPETEVEPEKKAEPVKKKKVKRRIIPDDLPVERVVYDVSEEKQSCEHCCLKRKVIGEEVSRKLEIIPPKIYVKEHVALKRACSTPGCLGGVVQAHRPEMPIPKAAAGPSLLAWVMTNKYCDHQPLNRQEQIFKRHSIEIPRKTQCDWMMQSAELLAILYQAMLACVLRSKIIYTDDTRLPLQEPGKKGKTKSAYVWVYGGDDAHPYVIYDFTRGRGREGPMAVLKNYEGYLQADAFSGYDELYKKEKIVECGCWAHARRKFKDAKSSAPGLSLQFIKFIRLLNDVETEGRNKSLTPDELVCLRKEKSVPILEKMKEKLDEMSENPKVLPQSAIGKAIAYTLNHWTALNRFTENGCIRIDNNLAENDMRPIVLGRKNWLFAGSERGGEAAAVIFSIIQSAKRNKIEPFAYITDVLTRLPEHPQNKIHELFPDQWKPASNDLEQKS